MTELAETSNIQDENLQLRTQLPIEFISEVKKIPDLKETLPTGEIAYFDVRTPDKLTILGRVLTRPLTNDEQREEFNKPDAERRKRMRVIEWGKFNDPTTKNYLSLEDASRKEYAGIIVRTPTRSPENAFDAQLALVAPLVKERSDKVDKIIRKRHLGALIVVEDLGDDQFKGWRRDQMKRLGLVINETANPKNVDIIGNYFVTFARPVKEKSAIDLTRGLISGNMFSDFTDAIERNAASQGLNADTSRLIEESKATKHFPQTLNNLKEGGNVDYTGTDDNGNATYLERSRFGEEKSSTDKDAFRVSLRHQEKVELPKAKDVIERTDITCASCGNHPKDRYYAQPGRVRNLLFKDTTCNEAHPDGYPRNFGNHQYVRPLEMLPAALRKKGPIEKK